MCRIDAKTVYPDHLTSQTIGMLRWVLMALVVLIHTNLVADTGCTGTAYGVFYRWAGNVVWLASPLFFLISGYLFVASGSGFSWDVFVKKCRGRFDTWLMPYLLWNTIFLLFYGVVGLVLPSVLGEIPPLQEMTLVDILKAYCCIRGQGFNSGPIDGPLWFLRDLMAIALFTPLYMAIVRKHKATIIVPLILGSLPLQLGFESEMALFMVGCWLNVWYSSLSDLLQKPWWRPLSVYLIASVLVTAPLSLPEEIIPLFTLIRNLSGMLLVARLCAKVVEGFPSKDWRALAEPVFFVFAFHSMVTRVLTKVAAQWLVAHQMGSAGFFCAHLLDAVLAIAISLLVYHILRRLFPNTCRWIFGKSRLWR
ncbi:MAG: acyltransferase [Bacteroidales bacterium]|nr:acyltransferase [Bacteroidales bacterium]